MRHARFLVGLTLALAPSVCFAQQASSGATVSTEASTGAYMLQTLEMFSEGALPLEELAMTDKERAAWNTEVARYVERSTELRARCHEELRKANRDTIATKAAQCVRSDLLLEATHRRKQRERFEALKGVPEDVIGGATTGIDAWLDAAASVIDGIDTGVFGTVDSLKVAKRNLNATYRVPMLDAFKRVRVFQARAVMFSIAARVLEAWDHEERPELEPIANCLVSAELLLDPSKATFNDGLTEVRRCIEIIEDASN